VDAEGNSKLKELWTYDDKGLLLEHLEYDVERSNEIATFLVTVCDQWTYDQNGQPLLHEQYEADRLVSRESWVYDAQGNVLENHSWSNDGYEERSSNTVNTYNEAGQLTACVCDGEDALSSWNYRSAFTYDDAGNLIEEAATHESGETLTSTWSYDEAGKLLKSVTYYNMDGWVTCLTENIYDAKGQLTEEGYHEFYENELLTGSNCFYTYDEAGNLVEEICTAEGGTPLRTAYEYDPQGNCTKITQYEGEAVISLLKRTYDETGKLLDVSTDEVESFAAYGDEIRMITYEDGVTDYVAIKYKTLRVDEGYAREIEEKNAYILSLLEPQNS
jgi:YD repeat-containing protein